MDYAAVRDLVMDHYHHSGRDEIKAHEIYHDDAILELPQSGERFVGKQTFLAWRAKYPAKLDFKSSGGSAAREISGWPRVDLLRRLTVDVHDQIMQFRGKRSRRNMCT